MDINSRELFRLVVKDEDLLPKSILKTAKIGNVSREKVIDWICFVYHPKTPLRGLDSMIKMKMEAAIVANFPTDETGRFRVMYEEILLGKNPNVNHMTISYLKMFNNSDYMELKIYKEMFEDELLKMTNMVEKEDAKPTDIKNIRDARDKSIDLQSKLKKRIKELETNFLNNDDGQAILSALYQEMELEQLGITAEEIAKRLKESKDPLYGYVPDIL